MSGAFYLISNLTVLQIANKPKVQSFIKFFPPAAFFIVFVLSFLYSFNSGAGFGLALATAGMVAVVGSLVVSYGLAAFFSQKKSFNIRRKKNIEGYQGYHTVSWKLYEWFGVIMFIASLYFAKNIYS